MYKILRYASLAVMLYGCIRLHQLVEPAVYWSIGMIVNGGLMWLYAIVCSRLDKPSP